MLIDRLGMTDSHRLWLSVGANDTHKLFFTVRLNHTGSYTYMEQVYHRQHKDTSPHRYAQDNTQTLTPVHSQGLLMHTIIANGSCLKGEVVLTSDQAEVRH